MDQQTNKEEKGLPALPQGSSCQRLWWYLLPTQPGREKGKEAGGKGSPGACRGFSSPEILGTSRLPLVVTLPSQLLLQCLQTLLSKQA